MQIPLEALRAMVLKHEGDLWKIFKGQLPSERHQLYRARGKSRRDLEYSVRGVLCQGCLVPARLQPVGTMLITARGTALASFRCRSASAS